MTTTKPGHPTPAEAPVPVEVRNTSLDMVRGIAVLGILGMNGVSYGLAPGAYYNLAAGGSHSWLDWMIGGFGEVFIDQKFMGLFSMLFGAGIVLFADRAQAKGRRPALFSLWRNFLLFAIGVLHTLFWEGDVLTVYALASPLLIALRNRRPATLLWTGTTFVLFSPFAAVLAQTTVDVAGNGLGEYWFATGPISDEVGLFLLFDYFCRSLGMMLIGVALYRLGVVGGQRSIAFYRRCVQLGFGTGIPIAAAGLAYVALSDFSPAVALVGGIPNTIATIPMTLGYLGLITLWNQRSNGILHDRIRAVGRMALTNYLSQTVIGVGVLRWLLDDSRLTRTDIALFIMAVWVLQLCWSRAWLTDFRYGPAEWLWRSATYLEWQPFRITRNHDRQKPAD